MNGGRLGRLARVLAVAAVVAVVGGPGSAAGAEDKVARGEYLAAIMDCTGCHTGGALAGKPDPARHLAGSDIGFHLPGLGIFYPPNLTADPETGLGSWSAAEIITAVREGLRPDGRELAPVMPWHSYAALNDADAEALAAYLKSLPPTRFETPGPFGESQSPGYPYLTVVVPE